MTITIWLMQGPVQLRDVVNYGRPLGSLPPEAALTEASHKKSRQRTNLHCFRCGPEDWRPRMLHRSKTSSVMRISEPLERSLAHGIPMTYLHLVVGREVGESPRHFMAPQGRWSLMITAGSCPKWPSSRRGVRLAFRCPMRSGQMTVIFQAFQALFARWGEEIPIAPSQLVEGRLHKDPLQSYCLRKGAVRSRESLTKGSPAQHLPPAGVTVCCNAVDAAPDDTTCIWAGVARSRGLIDLTLTLATLAFELHFLGHTRRVLHKCRGRATASSCWWSICARNFRGQLCPEVCLAEWRLDAKHHDLISHRRRGGNLLGFWHLNQVENATHTREKWSFEGGKERGLTSPVPQLELIPRAASQKSKAQLDVVPQFVGSQLQNAPLTVKLASLHAPCKRVDKLLALVAGQPSLITRLIETTMVVRHNRSFLVDVHVNLLDDLNLVKVVKVDHRKALALRQWAALFCRDRSRNPSALEHHIANCFLDQPNCWVPAHRDDAKGRPDHSPCRQAHCCSINLLAVAEEWEPLVGHCEQVESWLQVFALKVERLVLFQHDPCDLPDIRQRVLSARQRHRHCIDWAQDWYEPLRGLGLPIHYLLLEDGACSICDKMPWAVPRDIGIIHWLHHTTLPASSDNLEPLSIIGPDSRPRSIWGHSLPREEQFVRILECSPCLRGQKRLDGLDASLAYPWPCHHHFLTDEILHVLHRTASVVILLWRQQLVAVRKRQQRVCWQNVGIHGCSKLCQSS